MALLTSHLETQKLAYNLAELLVPRGIVALHGDIGSGKTYICSNIIKHICGSETIVQSPTYNLLITYKTSKYTIFHYDLYRLNDISEIYELDFDTALENICLIEWPEVIKEFLPSHLAIHLKIVDEYTREYSLESE